MSIQIARPCSLLALSLLAFGCGDHRSSSLPGSIENGQGVSIAIELDESTSPRLIDTRKPLRVVLTNSSAQPITVWNPDTSNGQRLLSFQFTNSRTNVVHEVSRAVADDDDSTQPSTIELPPGQQHVVEVFFGETDAAANRVWQGLPELNSPDSCQVVARFESSSPTLPTTRPVWSGKVASPPRIARLTAPTYNLLVAIQLNDCDRVRTILEESPELADNFLSLSPLRMAATLGRVDMCRHLMEKYRVDVNDFERGSGFPIIVDALAYPEIVRLLIEHRADLKTRITMRAALGGIPSSIGDDATVLHYAAASAASETVTLLLDHGVDPFATARGGFAIDELRNQQTALDVAAFFGNPASAQAILDHPRFAEADPDLCQRLLNRCLRQALRSSWTNYGPPGSSEPTPTKHPQLVELLWSKGADVEGP